MSFGETAEADGFRVKRYKALSGKVGDVLKNDNRFDNIGLDGLQNEGDMVDPLAESLCAAMDCGAEMTGLFNDSYSGLDENKIDLLLGKSADNRVSDFDDNKPMGNPAYEVDASLVELVPPLKTERLSAQAEGLNVRATSNDLDDNSAGCVHLRLLPEALGAETLYEYMGQRRCSAECCGETADMNFCMLCFTWFCGRTKKGHKQEHYEKTKHSLFYCLHKDRIWCQECHKCLGPDCETILAGWCASFQRAKTAESLWFATNGISTNNRKLKKTEGKVLGKKHSAALKRRASVNRQDAERKSDEKCTHMKSVKTAFNKVPADLKVMCQYTQCPFQSDLAICLFCYKIFCGEEGEQHMGLHMLKNESHAICMRFANLSFWCYRCNKVLDPPASSLLTKIRSRFVSMALETTTMGEEGQNNSRIPRCATAKSQEISKSFDSSVETDEA